MCGIVGIVSGSPAAQPLYDGLTMLQHRGQDAAGIVTQSEENFFCLRKESGLVSEVFSKKQLEALHGNCGIGHVRYPTAGTDCLSESQPLYVNSPYGIVLAHNGNLTNAEQLTVQLFDKNRRHMNTDSDSEVLLNILADEINGQKIFSTEILFSCIDRLHSRVEGAYAVVGMIANYGLFAFRDLHGLRPLLLGRRQNEHNRTEWMVASESVALDISGFERYRDVLPGEGVFIDFSGNIHFHQSRHPVSYTPCVFELVYFARPDSVMDGISVYQARLKMGQLLARQIISQWGSGSIDIDVVMPVPDTSRTAALEVASGLQVDYREGFIKNRYVGRTFIMAGQKRREKSVRRKLNPIHSEFVNKNVLIVDDSIVRGTTSREIIKLARQSGAQKVYFASASPPVRYQYVYGIDMPKPSELIARNSGVQEIADSIGADRVFYQGIEEMLDGLIAFNTHLDGFDASCFTGQYATGTVTEEYLDALAKKRNQKKSGHRNGDFLSIYNVV